MLTGGVQVKFVWLTGGRILNYLKKEIAALVSVEAKDDEFPWKESFPSD